jgi:hypothetical protein
MGDKLFRAKEPFTVVMDGVQVVVNRGDLVREGHPLLKKHADLFTEGAEVRFDVEQATAAPGEKRGPGRPKKSTT